MTGKNHTPKTTPAPKTQTNTIQTTTNQTKPEKPDTIDNETLLTKVYQLLETARTKTAAAINLTMVKTYYEIGRLIIEEEQKGETRAGYGTYIIKNLSENLTKKFGKGFSTTNLKQMRQFYLTYANTPTNRIGQTASDQLTPAPQFTLSYSHYLTLMRINNISERQFYEIEAQKNNWSLTELKRQYNTSLYERLALSKNREKIQTLSKHGQLIEKPQDIIKDPYILEFLGLPELPEYSESELEKRIITNLQTFLLELGRGFTFVGRQVRFTIEEEHFRVDLVFFNRILKCFVLFDLKIGELKHQDIGQMQMYVNYYDRKIKLPEENPTIGIILCKDKKQPIVEMTLPQNNTQIFASKYETVLPSKEELRKLLETAKAEEEQ